MKKSYSQIAWGLAFALIDFRLGSFDVLPDVIGYLLILIGLSRLNSNERPFSIAWGAAGIQFILSILQILGLQIGFSLTNYVTPSFSLLTLTAFSTAIELTMLYGICEGIRRSALSRGTIGLAESARSGWNVLFGFGALTLFVFPFQLNFTFQDMMAILFLLALGYWICCLWVIFLVRRAGRELPSSGGDGDPDPDLGRRMDITI
ncbi:hypothetical protein [Cohnella herbarum]|uniref:Uncharacterized protein n=1 Tax=Cohnella herbarum TaxID=2728023 RepID=A0A7Z2VPS9_9BACL|nr:hypothetical protein [Cohnella herbarum]QJD86941.1 hypothetical protein HH215_29730 [Cohnella herbarum]